MSPPKINATVIGRNPSSPLVSNYVLTEKEKRLSEKKKKERQEILLDRQQEKEFHRLRSSKVVYPKPRPNATVIGRNPSTPSVTSTLYANPPKDRATKYEGVYLISSYTPKCGGIYRATIKDLNGKEIFIGTFTLACDAAYNYDRSHRFYNMGKCNFQSIEEYMDALRREITARVDEYYETFSEEEKKILSKQQLREKIVEIHKGNRLSKEYLFSKLKGTGNVGRTRSIHLDTFLAKLFGKHITGRWHKDDVTKLLELEKKHHDRHNKWELISKELGNRSAKQCCDKFGNLKKTISDEQVTGRWHKDDVTKLLELEKKHEKSINKWELISKELGNRSAQQCCMKFHFMKGTQVTGRWHKDDVTKLLELEKKHHDRHNKWELISKELGNRSAKQCRDKFGNLKKTIPDEQVTRRWHKDDVTKLLELEKKHHDRHNKFELVAKELGNRSAKQCCNKFHRMKTKKRKQPTSTICNESILRKKPKISLPKSIDVQVLLQATNFAHQVVNIQKVREEYKSILQLTHRELEAYSRKQSMKVLEKEIEASSMSPYMENKIQIQTNAFVTAHILARRENGMSVN